MSPEAIALVFALLGGPTVLWLVYRVIRGPQNRRPDPFTDEVSVGVTSQLASELPMLSEYWVCRGCRSANRQGTSRCYSCKEQRAIADMSAPAAVPAGPALVPVMDAAPAQRSNAPAAATVTPATVTASERTPRRAHPVPQPTPVAAAVAVAATPHAAKPKRAARPRTPVPEGAAAADAPGAAAVAVDRAPAAQRSAASSAVACPYLGLQGDPATRCSYPDTRHVCHAAASGGPSLLHPRRLVARVAGDGRTQPVDAETQATLCLTAEHAQCARFPAPRAIAGA